MKDGDFCFIKWQHLQIVYEVHPPSGKGTLRSNIFNLKHHLLSPEKTKLPVKTLTVLLNDRFSYIYINTY